MTETGLALSSIDHYGEADRFRQVAGRVLPAGKLVRHWRLHGGVSAQVTALEVAMPDGHHVRLVVRRYGAADLAHNPHVASDEFRLLQIARARGVAAPAPYAADETGTIFPTPYLVVGYVDGHTDFEPTNLPEYIAQLVAQLARIHSIQDSSALSFLPRKGRGFDDRPDSLDDSLGEGRIRDALESMVPSNANAQVLLHGDYWPGNVLWRDGRLAAIIDWEDACIGDPLADVANCRLELLWAFGAGAMDDFTELYRAMTRVDFRDLPYWDLCAALRPCSKLDSWGLDAETAARMRRSHQWFVRQALERSETR